MTHIGEVILHLAKDRVLKNDREHFIRVAMEEGAALQGGKVYRQYNDRFGIGVIKMRSVLPNPDNIQPDKIRP